MSSIFTSNGKLSYLKLACQAAVLLALVAGLLAFVTANKTLTLVVDGQFHLGSSLWRFRG